MYLLQQTVITDRHFFKTAHGIKLDASFNLNTEELITYFSFYGCFVQIVVGSMGADPVSIE